MLLQSPEWLLILKQQERKKKEKKEQKKKKFKVGLKKEFAKNNDNNKIVIK